MALFDSGTLLANVALSDTFNTWRIRTNQINTQAAGLSSNNVFTGDLNTFESINLVTALEVAQGGTGANTLTANNVILGDGTSAVKFVAPGGIGNVLTSNGSTWLSSTLPAGGLTYVAKTANYTTQDKEGVLADTTGGAFTVTLPADPALGAQVVVADSGGAWGTNNLTIGRNGETISDLAEDLVCDISGVSVQLVYDGSTWEVYAQIGGNGGTAVTLDGVQTLTNKTINGANNTITVRLTDDVTGTLPITNGGTGQTSYTNGQLLIGNSTGNTLAKATLTAGTGVSITNGTGTITVAATNNGTVTSVGGTGTVNGLTLTGTVTSSGNLTLGGTLAIAATQVTSGTFADARIPNLNASKITAGTLAVARGGTGVTTSTGTGATVRSTSPTLVTPVLGTPTSGNLSNCTVDGTNLVGFRNIPQNSRSAAYTLVLADAGKHIFHPSADTSARTFTIPANSSVAYPIGTAITFVNQNGAGVVTIAITTNTMRLSPDGTTGSRTLAANGSATCIKVTSTEWLISGSGLT